MGLMRVLGGRLTYPGHEAWEVLGADGLGCDVDGTLVLATCA